MNVLVTGSAGFLGWHIRCALFAEGHHIAAIDRDRFWSEDFEVAVKAADAIVHCAGVNRGSDELVRTGNLELARHLAQTYTTQDSRARIIYLNSTHIDRQTIYGDAKAEAAQVLANVATERFVDLVLPNVFGEGGRPFYNSVVSTFCHQIANNLDLTINDDAALEVVHAQDVADEVLKHLNSPTTGQIRLAGVKTSVVELAHSLRNIHEIYGRNVLPETSDLFARSLFNTLRSYGIPEMNVHALDPRRDDRGHLVELVKTGSGGQLFVSWTKPSITRGNHFHRRKIERFVVMEGKARIRMRKLFSSEVISIEVSGDSPVSVDIPTLHTHEITNTGDTLLLTAFWTDEIFNPSKPETYAEVV